MKCHCNADFQRAIPPKEIENGKGENPNYLQDKENNQLLKNYCLLRQK